MLLRMAYSMWSESKREFCSMGKTHFIKKVAECFSKESKFIKLSEKTSGIAGSKGLQERVLAGLLYAVKDNPRHQFHRLVPRGVRGEDVQKNY